MLLVTVLAEVSMWLWWCDRHGVTLSHPLSLN